MRSTERSSSGCSARRRSASWRSTPASVPSLGCCRSSSEHQRNTLRNAVSSWAAASARSSLAAGPGVSAAPSSTRLSSRMTCSRSMAANSASLTGTSVSCRAASSSLVSRSRASRRSASAWCPRAVPRCVSRPCAWSSRDAAARCACVSASRVAAHSSRIATRSVWTVLSAWSTLASASQNSAVAAFASASTPISRCCRARSVMGMRGLGWRASMSCRVSSADRVVSSYSVASVSRICAATAGGAGGGGDDAREDGGATPARAGPSAEARGTAGCGAEPPLAPVAMAGSNSDQRGGARRVGQVY